MCITLGIYQESLHDAVSTKCKIERMVSTEPNIMLYGVGVHQIWPHKDAAWSTENTRRSNEKCKYFWSGNLKGSGSLEDLNVNGKIEYQ
jgi:hypothetical protein